MSDEIPLARTRISEAAIEAAVEVLRSGWPGPGAVTERFEEELAERLGPVHVVATGSATAALRIAVALLDLPAGTEVVTTPNTFVATNHVLLHAGLTPVFADVERETGNVAVESIADRITDATGAIMVVHYAGYPVDLDAIHALADDHDLPVIQDCAHALGATYRGAPIGSSHGDACAFSFQATKNLAAVDGGALVLPDGDVARRARRLRWMGIDASTYERHTADGYRWAYDVDEVGFRATMSDLNGALARVGLVELDEGNERRAAIAARYRAGLASTPGVRPTRHEPDRTSAHYLFPVLVAQGRDDLLRQLGAFGIGASVHYTSNDRYPVYKPAYLPNAHWFSDHVLSLPMHPGLSDADVDRVIEAVTHWAALTPDVESD